MSTAGPDDLGVTRDLLYTMPSFNYSDVINDSMLTTEQPMGGGPPESFVYWLKVSNIIYWLLFVLITVLNGIVIITLLLLGRSRSRLHFFILNVATADFLYGLIYVLKNAILSMSPDVEWTAGDAMCKIVHYLAHVVLYASNFIQVTISLDRFLVVFDPFSTLTNPKRRMVMVGIVWVLSLVVAIYGTVYTSEYMYMDGNVGCRTMTPDWQAYFTVEIVLIYFVPVIIITSCYSSIVFIIWRKSGLETSSSSNVSNGHGDRSRVDGGKISQAKIKSIKMTLAIVLAFIFCWAPYSIYNTLHVYEKVEHNFIQLAMQAMSCVNSAVNPIIYIIFDFASFKKLRHRQDRRDTVSATKMSTITWSQIADK